VSGFTLLEILLVVGIIAILAGIVIIAINPARQLATVRNTERKSDLKQINSAMTQYYIDNGEYPATIPTTLTEICDTGTATSSLTCGSLINLTALVPTYITAIPTDPAGASSTLTLITPAYAADGGTGYKVGLGANNKLIVSAPLAELGASIVIGTTTGTTTGGSTLGDGLFAHYTMNDIGGTTVVDTKGHNGISQNSIQSVSGATGNTGTAISFNGSTDFIDLQNINPFTANVGSVSAWFKAVDPSGLSVIFCKEINGDGSTPWSCSFGFSTYGSYINFGVSDLTDTSASSFSGNSVVSADTWYHVAVVFDGTNQYIYLNGVLDGTQVATQGLGSNTNNAYIGKLTDGVNYPFNGEIDDVRIYTRVLTQDEVTQLAAGTEAE